MGRWASFLRTVSGFVPVSCDGRAFASVASGNAIAQVRPRRCRCDDPPQEISMAHDAGSGKLFEPDLGRALFKSGHAP